jgi:D-glycero-D-manno-heptose 1,7-bisphosphate phosphatase
MDERGHRLTTVFLDRDGVINRKAAEGDYVKTWAEFEFLPRALAALRLLAEHFEHVVVATNQRGVARGRIDPADLADIHARMSAEAELAGGRIDAIYVCPHAGGGDCRKPSTALLRAAARDIPGVTLRESAVVGDRAHDMQAAAAVGAVRVLACAFDEPMPEVDHVAGDLFDAAGWLVARAGAPASIAR